MVNKNLLRAKIVENGMNQQKVAQAIGMTEKTFCMKMKSGKFGLDEAQKMIDLLNIENPERIFFAQEVN